MLSFRTWQQITKDERVALDDFASANGNGRAENRAIENEGVEFAVFAARIDAGGELAEEFGSQFPARKGSVEFAGIDAGGEGAETVVQEAGSEFAGVDLPQGEDGAHLKTSEILFAVNAEILQEDIAETEVADAQMTEMENGFRHAGFVNGIGALRRDA